MTTYRDESGPGDTTAWTYDPATGLLVQKRYDYDDSKGPSYTYTPNGKLATRTWARGIVTSYAYDVLGSLLSVNYSDATPDVSYTYDRLGRQLSAIAASVSTNLYAYSTNTLELVAETQNGVVIDRSRDAFGRESGIALESDYDVDYGYDTFGRFAQVSNFQFQVSYSYSYLPGSSLISGMTASSGHAWTRSYEPNRNLITSVTNSFNGNLISAFDYANDAIGRRTARLDSQPAGVAITNAFGYNARSEVTTAAMGTNTYGYVFDPIGNRIVSTNNAEVTAYMANELNQYTNILSASAPLREPSHDDDGNMLTNGVWSYGWDGENRLIGVSSNNVLLATHTYDHQSRRIGKATGETTQSFLYDGWNLIREFQSSTIQTFHSSTNSYVWGLDMSGYLQGEGGIGGLLAVIQDSATDLPALDGNGNVVEYVSADGTIAAHYEYSPFGETVIQTGPLADTFSFRFSTKYWENEAKLYYYGYRFYVPSVGRWMNLDPVGIRGGVSLYGFTRNSPCVFRDTLGLKVKVSYNPPDVMKITPKMEGEQFFSDPRFGLFPASGQPANPWETGGWTDYPSKAVDCSCTCITNSSGFIRYVPSCSVTFDAVIYLNSLFDKTLSWEKDNSLQGVYGHEQKHVKTAKTLVEMKIVNELSKKFDSDYAAESRCDADAKRYKRMFQDSLDRLLDQGKDRHKNSHYGDPAYKDAPDTETSPHEPVEGSPPIP
jgi:RHS repeat-associated protein